MKPLIRTRDILRDIVEVCIPIVSFCIMFIVFVAQIFSRYVLRAPLAWAYEVTVSCYLWLVVLGACLAQRERAHVVFTLITDKMSLRWEAFCTFLGNLLIVVAFTWSFLPSVDFVAFMGRQKTSVLRIGLNIVYAPYIPFLAFTILYMLRDLVRDFKVFTGLAAPEEVETYRREHRNEVEQALENVEEGVKML